MTEYQRAVAAAKAGDSKPWEAWIAKQPKDATSHVNGVDVSVYSSATELKFDVNMTEGLSPAVKAALFAAIDKHH